MCRTRRRFGKSIPLFILDTDDDGEHTAMSLIRNRYFHFMPFIMDRRGATAPRALMLFPFPAIRLSLRSALQLFKGHRFQDKFAIGKWIKDLECDVRMSASRYSLLHGPLSGEASRIVESIF